MELRWTQEAAADLERIAITSSSTHRTMPSASCVRCEAPAALLMFPNRGRLGKKEGTRELVCHPCPTSWSTRFARTRSTLCASCTGRSSGRNPTTSPAGAIGCKAPRHPWHSRQRRQCRICNLQNLKGRGGFESHPLRFHTPSVTTLVAYLPERTLTGKPDVSSRFAGE